MAGGYRGLAESLIIVGMPRSGTTVLAEILGRLPGVITVIEPHMLWKRRSFHRLADTEVCWSEANVAAIRRTLLGWAEGSVMVEKSPMNAVRAKFVHRVLPEAHIVYIRRDPVETVLSNHARSLARDSLSLRQAFGKYIGKHFDQRYPHALPRHKLQHQLSAADLLAFTTYSVRMRWLRDVGRCLPFGPRLPGFVRHVREQGLLSYHCTVLHKARAEQELYRELYGPRYLDISLEDLRACRLSDLTDVVRSIGIEVPSSFRESIEELMKPSGGTVAPALVREVEDMLGRTAPKV